MKTKRQIITIGFAATGLLIVGILLSVYRPWQQTGSTATEDFEIVISMRCMRRSTEIQTNI